MVLEFNLGCHLLNELEQNHAKNKSALSRIADSNMQCAKTSTQTRKVDRVHGEAMNWVLSGVSSII